MLEQLELQWDCHECGGSTPAHDLDFCSDCGQLTCDFCLYDLPDESQDFHLADKILCVSCLTGRTLPAVGRQDMEPRS